MNYRLGLDMGATSIGWAVLKLDENDLPVSVADMGVRIFPDGRDAKSREPLSVTRRNARSARRRHDRYKLRRKDLLSFMIRSGLMPQGESARKFLQQLDPWEARDRAAREPVTPHVLGRALFHLSQRRGFKSNRIADEAAMDEDVSGMKQGIMRLRERVGSQTLGQFTYARHKKGESVRQRPQKGTGNRNEWNYYADRQMVQEEFDHIMEVQKKTNDLLNDDVIQGVKTIIFRQRPLVAPEPGWCALLHGKRRALLALPAVQKFRILQEVNNLEIEDFGEGLGSINQNQRQKLADVLMHSFSGVTKAGYLSWAQIRKVLGYKGNVTFNLDGQGRRGLNCDISSRQLSSEECFGSSWFELSDEERTEIVQKLLFESNRSQLINWLASRYRLTTEKSLSISKIRLPKGYGRVSLEAITKLIPHLGRGLTYDKACSQEGIQHSSQHTGERYDRGDLPYYGEILSRYAIGGDHEKNSASSPEEYYGKINNPTVHIALNQLQLIINALYKRYRAAPQQIHVELARDLKLPPWKLTELEKQYRKNRLDNEKINQELQILGVAENYDNRMRLKLWRDLAAEPDRRVCPFTGTPIPLSRLFTDEFEVEHLLPFSRSFDDGRANKIICTKNANRDKANKSPFDAFGHSPQGYDWNAILARVENLHGSKRWRFLPDAWEKLQGNHENMIARLLTDTQYMSKVARQYMEYVCDPARVVASNGRLTAKLRHHWGMNGLATRSVDKDRTDHRHHAIDALVVACISPSTIQKLSRAAQRAEKLGMARIIDSLPPPFPCYQVHVVQKLAEEMIISYKADNSNPYRAVKKNRTRGALHEETNYGLVGPSDKKGYSIYRTRVPLDSIEPNKKIITDITDEKIRNDLLQALENENLANHWREFISDYGRKYMIRRVRVHRRKSDRVMIPITDKEGNAYRYVQGGSNFCIDIWTSDKGPKPGIWKAHPVSTYQAHQKIAMPEWRRGNPTAWRVMRLHINDMVVYEENDRTHICRVKKLRTDGRVYLRSHFIATEEGDKLSTGATATWLQKHNARRVWVDPLGRVHDAGKARKA